MFFAAFSLCLLFAARAVAAVEFNNLTVTAITTNSATLNRDSTEAYTGWIEYGVSTAYGNSTSAAGLEYFSEVDLSGLAAGTPYHYRIHSSNYLGQETVSPEYAFTTWTQVEVEAAIRAARADGGLPKTYYVKPDGNDAADGLSAATAWRSPAVAVAQADAGDTVNLLPGTWNDEAIVFKRSGIDIAPITLAGSGETTVLNNTAGNLLAVLSNGFSYLNVRDFTIKNYGNACSFLKASRVNVTRVTSHDIVGFAMQSATQSTYVHFDRVVVNRAGGHGILSLGNATGSFQNHIRFTGCSITESGHNGIDLHTNNEYITVAGCDFSKVHRVAEVMSHNFNNRYVMLRDNVLQEGDRGIEIMGTDDSFIYRNTLISTGAYGLFIFRSRGDAYYSTYPGSHRIIVKDNVFRNYGNAYDIYMYSMAADTDDTLSDLLFIGNSISKTVTFYGLGIQNNSFYDLPNRSTPFRISSVITGSSVNFTNNQVFGENAPNDPVYSVTQSELSLSGYTGTTTIKTYPMTARPVTGTAKVLVNKYDTTLAKGDVLVDFNADAVAPNSVDFVIGELKPDTNYLVQRDGADYHVVKSNAGRCIAFSNSEWTERKFTLTETDQAADLITPAAAAVPAALLLPPLPPRNLSAQTTTQRITLSWDAPLQDGGSPVLYYRIYRGTTTGRETVLKSQYTGLTYVDREFKHGAAYYYQITAVNAAGESVRSSEAAVTGIYYSGPENQVRVYPNPYVKGKSGNGEIIFGNLPQTATIRVYTVSGVLLQTLDHTAQANGGQTEWDVSDRAGGIYLYTVLYPGGTQKGKLCIVK